EDHFPAPSLAVTEGDVLGGPDEQRRAIAERRKPLVDLSQERAAAEDLAREHVHRATRLRRRKGRPVGLHHGGGELPALDVAGDDPLDEEVAAEDQIAPDRTAQQTREELRARIR